jgi:hypothetical protein
MDEIDEIIRIVKVKFSPRNLTSYIQAMAERGDLADYIPCGLSGRTHSERCRNHDCANCTASWCEGRCHSRKPRGVQFA